MTELLCPRHAPLIETILDIFSALISHSFLGAPQMDTSKSLAYRAAAAPTAVGTRYLSRCRASTNMCRQPCLCYCFPVLLQVWCLSRLRSVVTGGVDGMLTVQLSPRVVDAALLGLQSCKMLAVIWCWNQLLELSTPTQLHVAANVRNTPD